MQRAALPKVMLLPIVAYLTTEQCRNVKAQPLSPSCDILTPELPMGLAMANAGSVLSSTSSSSQSLFLPFAFGRCPSQSHSWRNTLRAKLFCLRIHFPADPLAESAMRGLPSEATPEYGGGKGGMGSGQDSPGWDG